MDELDDGERTRILSELAERVWAEFRLSTADEDRLKAEWSANVSEERLLALGLTAERRREAALFSAQLREWERGHRRTQIAEGLKSFGTFSTETLAAFDRDLRSDGPFAEAMEISHTTAPRNRAVGISMGKPRALSGESNPSSRVSALSGTSSRFSPTTTKLSWTRTRHSDSPRPSALRNLPRRSIPCGRSRKSCSSERLSDRSNEAGSTIW